MPYNDAPPGWWQSFVAAQPARTAKLAVVRADGAPQVAPVWVDLDGDDIVFMTGADSGRSMGADRADEYGRRNAVAPEMVVRVAPTTVVAKIDVAD